MPHQRRRVQQFAGGIRSTLHQPIIDQTRSQPADRHAALFRTLLVGESKKYFAAVYDRLGVQLTDHDYDGESSYNNQLASVLDELEALGLLRLSEGARCVFPAGFAGRDGARSR
jgi:arginyl-tRNA synthetase